MWSASQLVCKNERPILQVSEGRQGWRGGGGTPQHPCDLQCLHLQRLLLSILHASLQSNVWPLQACSQRRQGRAVYNDKVHRVLHQSLPVRKAQWPAETFTGEYIEWYWLIIDIRIVMYLVLSYYCTACCGSCAAVYTPKCK